MIRIALVDDHEVVRQGLHTFLSATADFDLVGEGRCGEDAVQLVLDQSPDILLLDMILPDFTGLQALEKINQHAHTTKVLFLSSFSDPNTAIPAMRAGAAGYLLKDINPKELINAIREVHGGAIKLHPDIAALLVNELNNANAPIDLLKAHNITEREADVIRLISKGFSNRDIAEQLHISQLTVKTHVSHVLDKLKLDDRTQVAIFAIHNKLDGAES